MPRSLRSIPLPRRTDDLTPPSNSMRSCCRRQSLPRLFVVLLVGCQFAALVSLHADALGTTQVAFRQAALSGAVSSSKSMLSENSASTALCPCCVDAHDKYATLVSLVSLQYPWWRRFSRVDEAVGLYTSVAMSIVHSSRRTDGCGARPACAECMSAVAEKLRQLIPLDGSAGGDIPDPAMSVHRWLVHGDANRPRRGNV